MTLSRRAYDTLGQFRSHRNQHYFIKINEMAVMNWYDYSQLIINRFMDTNVRGYIQSLRQ